MDNEGDDNILEDVILTPIVTSATTSATTSTTATAKRPAARQRKTPVPKKTVTPRQRKTPVPKKIADVSGKDIEDIDDGAYGVDIDETAEVESMTQPPEKRSVGRPRKKPIAPIDIKGILAEPTGADNSLELKYHDPALFSKILKLYKNYEVNDVEMRFNIDGVKMAACDHLGKSKIYVTIDGACMDAYYCSEPTIICVKRAHLEYAISHIGKSHSSIDLICQRNDTKTLYVIIRGSEYENDSQYEIEIAPKPDVVIEDPTDDSHYPISFSFSMAHFKTKIAQAEKIGKTLTIEKAGSSPIQLVGDNGGGKQVRWSEIYTKGERIGLKSDIDDSDVLRASIIIDYIQPFAKSSIGDQVHICAHKTEKISLTSSTNLCSHGYACTVKVFTELHK